MNFRPIIDRRTFFKNLSKITITGMALLYGFNSYSDSEYFKIFIRNSIRIKYSHIILKEIYNEVIELGSYNNENFIKREFFIDLDGDDKNKEEQVVVFNNRVGDMEKMIVQVTYFELKKNNSIIRYAKNTKQILCLLKEGKVEIEECDYDEKEVKPLLAKILKGIRNKKKLLNLIKHKK